MGGGEEPQTISVDPYTYVNKQSLIGGSNELSIGNLEVIVNDLSSSWGPIAGAIYSNHDAVTIDSPDDEYHWDDEYGPAVTNGGSNQSTQGYRVDVIDNLSGKHAKKNPQGGAGTDTYNMDCGWRGGDRHDLLYMTSGLQYATNLDDVLRTMCNMSSQGIRHATGDEGTYDNDLADAIYEGVGDQLSVLKGSGTQGASNTKVFYRVVTSVLRKDNKRFYNNYALVFYDFSLAPILVDGVKAWDVNDLTPDVDYGSATGQTAQTSYFENKSQNDSEVTAEISSQTEESVSNSMETTKSFSFNRELGIETKMGTEDVFGFLDVEQTISTKFSWQDTVETAWGSESSLSNTIGGSSSATVTLPPHTCIALEQSSGTMNKTISYKCPVALNYKVAVVSMSGKFSKDYDIADYVKSFSTVFGCGDIEGGMYAPQNLYTRAIEYDNSQMEAPFGQVDGWYRNTHVTKLNWNNIKSTYGDTAECINTAATQLPMFPAGGSLTIAQSSKNTELGNIQPLYRLTKVNLLEGEKNNVMTVGDTLSMNSYVVGGFNDKGVAYYGFDPSNGTWVLCEKDGTELETSEFAELVADDAAKTLDLVAKQPGTVYLKWVLSDTASYTAKGDVEVTRQSNPPTSPIVKVTINKKPVDISGYHIEVEGEPTVFVNQKLDLSNKLTASVYDETEAVVTHQVVYELQDPSAKADITNNEFSATEAGDYKVRATYTVDNQTIRSEFVTIHVNSLTKHDAVPATCTENGTIEYWECDQTGDLYADEDATKAITAEDTIEAALGHDLEHVEAAEPTCTKGGNIEHFLCKRCGLFFADEDANVEIGEGDVFSDALGHDWDEGEVTTEASCETAGEKTYRCKHEGCDATRSETIDAIGHNWGPWVEVAPATESTEGTEQRICNNVEGHVQERSIPVIGHVHDLQPVAEVAATCTADGNIAYYRCAGCQRLFLDENAQQELNEEDVVVKATGHAWDEGTVTTDPTCTFVGVRQFACTNEGCTATKEEDEPAHGHDWGEAATKTILTEPTCTTAGRQKVECGYKDSEGCTAYKTEAIEALDHAWDNGTVTVEPTCTTEGTKTFACTREGCTQTKTEPVAALGHEWGNWTKLNAKQHQRVCAHDAKHTQQEDHTWDSGVVTKEATIKSKGVLTYTCTTCGATKTASIPKVKIPGTLLNSISAKGKSAVVVKWNEIKGVEGYDVFLSPCNGNGKSYQLEVVESDAAGSTRKATIKDLKKNSCYKAVVKAFVHVDGKKVYIKSGSLVHCFTSNGTDTMTNPKTVKVNKTKVKLKKGKSTQIKASVVKRDSNKEILDNDHVATLRYKSTNTKVATVSKTGRILAKGKGKCKVYVFAANGAKKAVKVTVK